jgi:two-component sensor histidine kinase
MAAFERTLIRERTRAGVDLTQAGSLGLMIVQMLVQQLGARLEVERNGGTTVTMRFPLALRDERP